MTIKDIQKEMELGGLNPHRMAELRTILSGKYSRARDEWDATETQRLKFMNGDFPSIAKAEVEWGSTDEGEQWRLWKSQMRKSEQMMNALSTQIKIAQGEAMNLH